MFLDPPLASAFPVRGEPGPRPHAPIRCESAQQPPRNQVLHGPPGVQAPWGRAPHPNKRMVGAGLGAAHTLTDAVQLGQDMGAWPLLAMLIHLVPVGSAAVHQCRRIDYMLHYNSST